MATLKVDEKGGIHIEGLVEDPETGEIYMSQEEYEAAKKTNVDETMEQFFDRVKDIVERD